MLPRPYGHSCHSCTYNRFGDHSQNAPRRVPDIGQHSPRVSRGIAGDLGHRFRFQASPLKSSTCRRSVSAKVAAFGAARNVSNFGASVIAPVLIPPHRAAWQISPPCSRHRRRWQLHEFFHGDYGPKPRDVEGAAVYRERSGAVRGRYNRVHGRPRCLPRAGWRRHRGRHEESGGTSPGNRRPAPSAKRFARRAQGMSQRRLAETGDFDRTYSSLLERGLRTPTFYVILHAHCT